MGRMNARQIAVALSVAALAGCVGAPVRPAANTEKARGARADFAPGSFDVVFRKALQAVQAQGFTVVSCDAGLGVIGTAKVEGDQPCGGTTCLARDTAAVKLGFRRARVTVTREVWDSTIRAWRIPDDPTSLAAVSQLENELVREAALGRRVPSPDVSCPAAACESGDCVAWNVLQELLELPVD
jgi:hypothetical protein